MAVPPFRLSSSALIPRSFPVVFLVWLVDEPPQSSVVLAHQKRA